MLLVKSKESKNSDKSKAQLLLSLLFSFSFPAFSQSQKSVPGASVAPDFVSILLSLLLVVFVIFALAWVMKRFNVTHTGSGDLKPVASMMVGNRERIMVLQVGGEQHLLGITGQQINHLAKLDEPIQSTSAMPVAGQKFAAKLAHYMAKGQTGTGEKS